MKTISAFLFSALVALAVIAGSVFVLSDHCRTAPAPDAGRATPRLQINHDAQSFDAVIERAVLTRESLDNLIWQAQAAPQAQAPAAGWWQRFVCGIRATDIALAALALFVLLATFFQGLCMLMAMRASNRLAAAVQDGVVAAQRPYVFLREFLVAQTKNPLNDEIQTCTVQPVWENAGTAPIRNGRSHVNWKYFDRSVPSDFDFADFDELGNRIQSYDIYRPLIIGPRATALSPIINLEPALLRQVRDLQGKLLIWGWVEYDEDFSDRRHRTEFAYLVVASGSPVTHIGFSQYKLHNGVDDDCSKKPTPVKAKA